MLNVHGKRKVFSLSRKVVVSYLSKALIRRTRRSFAGFACFGRLKEDRKAFKAMHLCGHERLEERRLS